MSWSGGPVEFERVVPASGNLGVAGKQFWLGPARAGQVITFWADVNVIHLLVGGVRLKSLRSHLSTSDLARLFADGGRSAGPSPLPQAENDAVVEVERTVTKSGMVSLAGRYLLAAEILGGRRVTVWIEENTLMFLDPESRQLLRVRPNPLIWAKRCPVVRVREHSCICAQPMYELCTAAGLCFVRRLSGKGHKTVMESPWVSAQAGRRLWLQIMQGQAR